MTISTFSAIKDTNKNTGYAKTKRHIIKRYFSGELSLANAMSLCGYSVFNQLLIDAKQMQIHIPFNSGEINRIISVKLMRDRIMS